MTTTTNVTLIHTSDDFPSQPSGGEFGQQCNALATYLKGGASGTLGLHTITVRDDVVAGTATVTLAAPMAGMTVAVNGVNFTAEQEMARGTVTLASALAADTVTVNGTVFTAVSGTPVGPQFDISGSDTADAASLVAAINAHAVVSLIITASSALGVVTLRAVASGTGGNAYTLATSNNTRLAKSGTTLTGGVATGNNRWDYGDTPTQSGTELARAINASTSTAVSGYVSASRALGVVTVTALAPNGANSITVEYLGAVAKGTVTCASAAAADTVTINGTAFTYEQEMARGTVTFGSALAADTITVQSYVFTATAATQAGRAFIVGVSDTADAASFCTVFNADPYLATILAATSAAGVVTLRAVASGTAANAYTLATSNNTRLAKSGTTLSGGLATSNNKCDYGSTDTQAATELVRAIAASTTAAVNTFVTAESNAAVVTVRSKSRGLAGNGITLASSNNTRLAVSGARLAGGALNGTQASGTVTLATSSSTLTAIINGVSIAVTFDTSDTISAALMAAAINSSTNALVRGVVTATSAAGVVTITAVAPGIDGNAITLSATGTNATASGTRLASGAASTVVALSSARLSGGSSSTPVTLTQ